MSLVSYRLHNNGTEDQWYNMNSIGNEELHFLILEKVIRHATEYKNQVE